MPRNRQGLSAEFSKIRPLQPGIGFNQTGPGLLGQGTRVAGRGFHACGALRQDPLRTNHEELVQGHARSRQGARTRW